METLVGLITAAVDYAPIVTGIGTIAGAVALVYISIKGARMLLGMVKA